MDKKTRLERAMNCEEVDVVPAGFWFHFPEKPEPGVSMDEEVLRRQLSYYRNIDADMIKIMCDGYFDYPNEQIAEIKTASDWKYLEPMGPNHPFIRKQVERCIAVNEAVKGECCTFYNVFNPMSTLRFGTSEERLMRDIREDEEAVCHAFRVIAEDNAALAEAVIKEAGCTGIYYCVQNAEVKRFSAEEYRRIVTPSDKTVLERANAAGGENILHCCGWAGDKNRMEVWQDYEAKVVNWAVFVENMSLMQGRDFFHGKCVLGGFDNRPEGVLASGTESEIKAYTKGLIASFGKRGLILGGDCTFPRGIDEDRFRFVMEAAREV